MVLFPAAASAAPALEGITLNVTTNYYEVTGTNVQSLLASMRQRRVKSAFNAYTHWSVQWNYSFLPRRDDCLLKSFDTTVRVRYTMPRWLGSDQADSALRREWKRFSDALMAHEQGHAECAVNAAREMVRVMKSKPWSAPDRHQLKTKLDAECERIVKDSKAEEVAYDERTRHGQAQGAVLRSPYHRAVALEAVPGQRPGNYRTAAPPPPGPPRNAR